MKNNKIININLIYIQTYKHKTLVAKRTSTYPMILSAIF